MFKAWSDCKKDLKWDKMSLVKIKIIDIGLSLMS